MDAETGQPDADENLFRLNRKALIVEIYAHDRPMFSKRMKEQKVTVIPHVDQRQIAQWDKSRLVSECRKRGFNSPPYSFKIAQPQGYLTISKSGTKASKGVKVPPEFEHGLRRVTSSKTTDAQLRVLLAFIARDPRFKNGQPVVQPSFYDRTCQNVPCCGLFWLYWIAMMGVAALAYLSGDPLRLVRPTDYNGHTCGDVAHADTSNKKWLFYPQLAEDSLMMMQTGSLDCTQTYAGCFYGVCVESCPATGDIVCSYETNAALASSKMTAQQITARKKSLASVPIIPGISRPLTQKCWYVGIDQVDIAFRCFPFTRKKETKTYHCLTMKDSVNGTVETRTLVDTEGKNKDQIELLLTMCPGTIESKQVEESTYQSGTSSLSGLLNGVLAFTEQIFADISNAWYALMFVGPVLSGILSFCFIVLMMCFAGLLIWTIIIACQVAMGAITVCLFYKAGYLLQIDAYLAQSNGTKLAQYASKLGTFSEAFAKASGTDNTGVTGADEGNVGTITSDDTMWYWSVAAYVAAFIFLLSLVLPCLLRNQIKLCIALVKEAARSVRRTKSVLLYPFFGYFWVFFIFVYFLLVATYIVSTTLTQSDIASLHTTFKGAYTEVKGNGTVTYNYEFVKTIKDTFQEATNHVQSARANSTYSKVNFAEAQGNPVIRTMFLFHFFGWIWTTEFIKAIGMITISGAVALDYWVDMSDKRFRPHFPVGGSFWRALRYHAGTACFGSLVVSIVRMIRYVMMYIDHKTSEMQKNSKIVMILMKVVHCCLWCFEKCVRFITTNAYIMTAIEGTGFCTSAWRSFKLIFSNSLRIATTQSMSSLLLLLAQLGISLFCTIMMWITIKMAPQFQPDGDYWVDSPVAPCILVLISSGFVTFCFMSVYQMAILTLLVSFCLDEEKFKKGLYKKKTDSRGFPDKRMFCMVNNKVGLIKLVSKNAKEELMQANADREKANQASLMGNSTAEDPGFTDSTMELELAPMRGEGSVRASPAQRDSTPTREGSRQRPSTPPRSSRRVGPSDYQP